MGLHVAEEGAAHDDAVGAGGDLGGLLGGGEAEPGRRRASAGAAELPGMRHFAFWLLMLGVLTAASSGEHTACDAAGRPAVTFVLPGFESVGPGAGYGNLKAADAEVTWRVDADPLARTLAADRARLASGRISDFREWKVPGATGSWSFYDPEDEEAPVWTLHVFGPAGHLHLGVSAFEWKVADPKARGRELLEAIAGTARAH